MNDKRGEPKKKSDKYMNIIKVKTSNNIQPKNVQYNKEVK